MRRLRRRVRRGADRRQDRPPLRRIVVDLDDTFASLCEAATRHDCELGDLVARAVADSICSIIGTEVAHIAIGEGDEL
ncbi:MAG: hypothetical protein ACRD2C_17695 [Acidimicrobiales bacterium]